MRASDGAGGPVVLNIGRLAPGGEDYYLATIATDVADYHAGRGEAPGRWMGQGTRELGLAGVVTPERLRAVLGGLDPATGRPLVAARNRRVPGFDLAFRPPKSVSLLWALSDDSVALEVRRAHDEAVEAALRYLEQEVIRSRRGHNGAETVEVTGVVAAAFRHRTSRANDPLLHTHVLVANCVRAVDDGQWRTLDSRRLYRHAKTAGLLYQAHLRYELARRLGVEWGPMTDGHADLVGAPRQVIEEFSRRRAQILHALDDRGLSSARAAQVATLETRPPKDHDVDVEGLVRWWRQRATERGFGAIQVAALVHRHRTERRVNLPVLVGRLLGPQGLTAHASTFDRRDVLQAICQQLPDGAPIEHVQRLADALLTPENSPVIDLDDPRGVLRRLAAATDDEHRYTTADLLVTEQRLIHDALARLDAGVATVPQAALQAALRSRPLSGEQAAMVHRLVSSGAGVEVVLGKAGCGKTFALSAAREAWEAAGVPLVGCALSARAALELQRGSGIRSMTLHRLLADLDHPQHGGLIPGSVVVVDEAAMVATRMLARLLQHADRADAKVVLVGDHHQLPEIDAGGAFAALTTRLPVIELTGNRRQVEPWERAALDELRHGSPTMAATVYRDHDRIHFADTGEQVREQLVGDWYEAVAEHGRDAVMVARRRNDVAGLNRRARRQLAARGELHGPVLETAGGPLQAGDRAICLHNDYRLGVTNGTRGTVVAVHPQRHSLDFLPDGASATVSLGPSYLDRGWLDHGYAVTAHKAQGLTCDATFVLTDEGLYREWAYVALSRGRHDNHLYVVDESPQDAHTHPAALQTDQRESLDQLTARLERVARQRLGVDHLDDQTRATIDDVVAAAQQRQRVLERRLELYRGLATEL